MTATGTDRTYDGTTAATVTLADKRIAGDVLTATYSSAAFASKNKGTSRTITVNGIAISGTDAANYTLANTTATTTANIAARALTLTAVTNTRTYDGSTTAAATPISSGLQTGDSISGLTETYDTSAVGTGKTLSVSTTYTISDGNSGANYTVTRNPVATGVINKAPSTTTLTSSTTLGTPGSSITFTATVPSGATGTVQFYDNVTALGAAVAVSSGVASYSTSSLASGTHVIKATYSGDTSFATSTSATFSQVVASAPVVTTQNANTTVGVGPNQANAGATDITNQTASVNSQTTAVLQFNGTSSVVTLPSSILSDFRNGFSAGVWVYPTANTGTTKIFDFGSSAGNDNISLSFGTDLKPKFSVWKGTSEKSLTATSALTLNTWQYLAVVLQTDGSTTLYKNGTSIGTTTSNTKLELPNNVTRANGFVGRSNTASDSYFKGQMSSLSLWNTPQTPAQSTVYTGSEAGLVGFWPMNVATSKTTVTVGETATLRATATGYPIPTVQWFSSTDSGTTWNSISGATSTTYSFNAVTGDNGKQFKAQFTNSAGTNYSDAVTLGVQNQTIVDIPYGNSVIEFQAETYFTKAGSTLSTSGKAYLGFKPSANQSFVKVLCFDGGVGVDTDKLTLTFTGKVSAAIVSPAVDLAEVPVTTINIMDLVNSNAANYACKPLTVGSTTLTVTSMKLVASDDKGVPGIVVSGGLTLPMTGMPVTGEMTIDQNGVRITKMNNPAKDWLINGFTFDTSHLNTNYDSATKIYTATGTAKVSVPLLGFVNVQLGSTAPNGTVQSTGLRMKDGTITNLDMTVTGTIGFAGVSLTAKNLNVTYVASADRFTMTGTASLFVATMGNVDVTLGKTATNGTVLSRGLVVEKGALKVFDMTIDANMRVGGGSVLLQAENLNFTYLNGNAPTTAALNTNSSGTSSTPQSTALTFDGTSGYVKLPSGMSDFRTGLTAGIWVYPSGAIGNNNTFFDFGNGDGKDNIRLGRSGTTNNLEFKTVVSTTTGSTTTATATVITATNAIEMNKWQFFSVVMGADGSTTLYKNGQSIATGTVSVPAKLNRTQNYLGRSNTDSDALFTGQMSNFGLWNKPLTAAQVTSSMNSTTPVTTTGLVGFWKMNDTATSTSVLDAGTNALNGTDTALPATFAMSGTASIYMDAIGYVSVKMGQFDKAGNMLKRGLVEQNGKLMSLDMTVNSDIKVGTVLLGAKDLNFTYTSSTDTFTMSGTASLAVAEIGMISVTLGDTDPFTGKERSKGLVVTAGKFVSLDMTVDGLLNVGEVVMEAKSLKFTYVASTDTFTMTGKAAVAMEGVGAIEVSLGDTSFSDGNYGVITSGLVVQKGKLKSLDMEVSANVQIQNVTLVVYKMKITFDSGTDTWTMTGTAGMAVFPFGVIAVTLGKQAADGTVQSQGMVVTHGHLVKLDMTVNTVLNLDGVVFTARNLNFTYTKQSSGSNNYVLGMSGTAYVTFVGINQLSVTFGHNGTPGMVITNGKLESLDVTVNGTFLVGCATFGARDLEFKYTASNKTFTLAGTANVNIALISQFDVTFGHNNSPGLVISNGTLQSLDLTVSSSITFASYTLANSSLELTYNRSNDTYKILGSARMNVGFATLSVYADGGSNGAGIVIRNGAVTNFEVLITSDLTLGGLTFAQGSMKFAYYSTYTVPLPWPLKSQTYSRVALITGTSTVRFGSWGSMSTSVSATIISRELTNFNFDATGSLSYKGIGLNGSFSASYANSVFDASGTATITLKSPVPSPVIALLGSNLGRVSFSLHIDGNRDIMSRNSYVSTKIDKYSVKFNFDGSVDTNFYIDGAQVFYDPDNRGIYASPNPTATTDAFGEYSLSLPPNPTGQLVASRGIVTSTALWNPAVLTAPVTSTTISSLTTVVNNLEKQQVPEATAISYVDSSLNIPSGYNVLETGTEINSYHGDVSASKAYTSEVTTYIYAHETAALLSALTGAPGYSSLMSYAFNAISIAILNRNGDPLDLTDPAVVSILIQSTATAARLSVYESLSNGGATIIARICSNIGSLATNPATLLGTPGYLFGLARYQKLANSTIADELTSVASTWTLEDQTGITNLVASETLEHLTTEASLETIGNILPPILSIDNVHANIVDGQPTSLDYTVSVHGTSSSLLKIKVHYSTADLNGSSAAGDYTQTSGDLTWSNGDTSSRTFTVPIAPGTLVDPYTLLVVNLSTPENAVINPLESLGTNNETYSTTTTLQTSSIVPTVSDPVTLTAHTVRNDGSPWPVSGLVTFYDGLTVMGTATIDANGNASFTTSNLVGGSHAVKAVFTEFDILGEQLLGSESDPIIFIGSKADQTISFDSINNTTYGVPLVLLNATASSGNLVTYRLVSGPATLAGSELSITGTGTVVVAADQLGDDFYNAASVAQQFTVAPAVLNVTVADQSSVYGEAIPAPTQTITGFVNGESVADLITLPTLSTAPDGSGADSYAIISSGGAASNYTFNYVSGTLTIAQAPLTVTVDAQTMTYGENLPTPTYSISGFVNDQNISVLTAVPTISTVDAGSTVGQYDLTASGAVATNYSFNYVSASLTINPAPLTITANDQTMVYGGTRPTLTASLTGLVNGDPGTDLVNSLTLDTVNAFSGVGAYNISISGATSSNYLITYQPGTLTITPAALTITADNQTIVQGYLLPQLTASYSGLVNGDTPENLNTAVTLSTMADASSDAGTYAIYATDAADPNYTISYAAGSLVITRRASSAELTASTQAAVLGQAVTFATTVLDPGTTLPVLVGNVQFQIDGVNAGDPVALDVNGIAWFTTSDLSLGSHTITAVYSGTTNVQGATASVTVTVAHTSQTNLAVSATDLRLGSSATLTATVAAQESGPSIGTPTGSVQFAVDGVAYGRPVAVNGSGVAVLGGLSELAVGTHQLTATFTDATGTFATSLGTAALNVFVAADQSVMFQTPTSANFGDDSIDLVATAGSGLPVSFTLVSGPATLAGGRLTFT